MDIREVRKIKVGLGEKTIDKFIEESDILKNFPDKVEGILEENENNKKIFDVGIEEKVAIFFKKKLYEIEKKEIDTEIEKINYEISKYKGKMISAGFYSCFFKNQNQNPYKEDIIKYDELNEKLNKIKREFLFYSNGIKDFVKKYLLNEIFLEDSEKLEKIKKEYENYLKYIYTFTKYIKKDEDRFFSQTYENEIKDINKGNWDIFDDLDEEGNLCVSEGEYSEVVEIEDEIYARNPKYDIVESGVVGIDFGTKSTVVVSYRDDNAGINNSKTLPIRISGNMNDIERTENYENATIIHFSKSNNFMWDYNFVKGRPHTHYCDIQVSLEAENELKRNTEDFDINEFMLDLKQWASSKNKKKKIRDEEGFLHTINGYLDLKEGEFDPIEIYAYYIGCRINNMAQYSIFLEYYLSFPVTYELEVKNRILNSFR